MAAKATDGAKELKNIIEKLKANIVEKDTCLDHLQKKNDELSTFLENAKKDAIEEFRTSNQFTDVQKLCY